VTACTEGLAICQALSGKEGARGPAWRRWWRRVLISPRGCDVTTSPESFPDLLAWVFFICILLSPIAVLWQIWELVGNAVGHARRGERFDAAMDAMGAGLWVARLSSSGTSWLACSASICPRSSTPSLVATDDGRVGLAWRRWLRRVTGDG